MLVQVAIPVHFSTSRERTEKAWQVMHWQELTREKLRTAEEKIGGQIRTGAICCVVPKAKANQRPGKTSTKGAADRKAPTTGGQKSKGGAVLDRRSSQPLVAVHGQQNGQESGLLGPCMHATVQEGRKRKRTDGSCGPGQTTLIRIRKVDMSTGVSNQHATNQP